MKDWFLNPATRLIKGKNNGFTVLMICLAYLEGIEQYRQGVNSDGRSKQFFKNSIQRIYNNAYLDNDLRDLYHEARCGLFHTGMVSGRIIINPNYVYPLEFDVEQNILINPSLLLNDIKSDFKTYISTLKNVNNVTERQFFNSMFSNI